MITRGERGKISSILFVQWYSGASTIAEDLSILRTAESRRWFLSSLDIRQAKSINGDVAKEREGRALTRARYDSRRERYETRTRKGKREIYNCRRECDSDRGGLDSA